MMHPAVRERYRGAVSALRLPASSISASASAFSGFSRSSSVPALTLDLALTLAPTLVLTLVLALTLAPTPVLTLVLALALAPTLGMELTTVAPARSVRIRPTTHSTPPQARHLR
jgi:hypothetical protein